MYSPLIGSQPVLPPSSPSCSGPDVPRKDHTIVDIEQSVSSREFANELGAQLPVGHVTIEMQEIGPVLINYEQHLQVVVNEMSQDLPVESAALQQTVIDMLGGDVSRAEANAPPGSISEVFISLLKNAGLYDVTLTTVQRAQIIVDSLGELLGKLGRNEFEGDLGRLASNLTISTLHTGLIVGTLTTIRQLLGFAIEKGMQSNAASLLTRNVIGGLSLMIGPALNILGAVRDEWNGTANADTRLSRLATFTLSMTAVGMALAAPQALSALASSGPQMAFYTYVRDIVQLFNNTTNNAHPTAGGVAATGALYGGLQYLAGTAMDTTAPNSGAGYARSVAEEIVKSLMPFLPHDLLRGAFNALVEILDQVLGGELMHALQGEKAPEGYRIKFGSTHNPNASQVADGILTTAAMRTSFGQTIMAAAISTGTFFSSLGLPPAVTNHAVNGMVALVAFVGYPGFVFAHAGNKPVETTTV